MTRDDKQNVYLVGFEQGLSGVTNIEPDGDSRGFVEKRSPTGTQLWRRIFNTAGTDTAERVVVDTARGRVFVVGRTSGAFRGQKNAGKFDLFVVALDTEGKLLGLTQAGSKRPQHPTALALLPGGDVVVAGYDDVYVPSNYVESVEDSFWGRFAVIPAGGMKKINWWQAETPAPDSFTGVAAAQDGSGALFVTGVAVGGPGQGVFVERLDAAGTVVWKKILSKSTLDWVAGVVLSPAGELIVAGSSFLTLGKQSFGQQDAFVLKLAPDTGKTLWAAQAGSAASDWVTSLDVGPDGQVYVSGMSPGSLLPGGGGSGAEEPFVLVFDAQGAQVRTWQASTTAREHVSALAPDGCGGIVIAGHVEGELLGPGAGKEDLFFRRVAH
ncbi:hypothetical protein KEG38_53345 [Polyangium jinanense]|nr:hypothetical protein [Polyangium jinanense]MDC3962712.1 hypothetical protein [Polyangium jinanense]